MVDNPNMSSNANMSTGNQAPSYLQPQTNNASPAGAVNNMVRALMAGNDAYNQAHPGGVSPALSPGSSVPGAMGPTSIGGPMGPSPISGADMPTDPSTMSGGLGQTAFQPPMPMPRPDQNPFMGGASPMTMGGVDPATAALMSPIPGMS